MCVREVLGQCDVPQQCLLANDLVVILDYLGRHIDHGKTARCGHVIISTPNYVLPSSNTPFPERAHDRVFAYTPLPLSSSLPLYTELTFNKPLVQDI